MAPGDTGTFVRIIQNSNKDVFTKIYSYVPAAQIISFLGKLSPLITCEFLLRSEIEQIESLSSWVSAEFIINLIPTGISDEIKLALQRFMPLDKRVDLTVYLDETKYKAHRIDDESVEKSWAKVLAANRNSKTSERNRAASSAKRNQNETPTDSGGFISLALEFIRKEEEFTKEKERILKDKAELETRVSELEIENCVFSPKKPPFRTLN